MPLSSLKLSDTSPDGDFRVCAVVAIVMRTKMERQYFMFFVLIKVKKPFGYAAEGFQIKLLNPDYLTNPNIPLDCASEFPPTNISKSPASASFFMLML